ncbi:cytochrome c-type biogenesis protein CcmH [Aquihabitans sp. G128]|uniref:cytochrome c-type biogenesis protein n=1 Tax=Aquihabitans sp. G128 TaxID=2849779 RepID=UPI001C21D5DA|nr:cytochrome c-type biogenesis protein CcmH [Aquihabitans sp. G128]QXC60951.1 cytochrome c-type biogenesis protein CcmH [Aquihabitans sp. G128]
MSGPGSKAGLARWAPWLAMALVVLVALGIGTFGGKPRTDEQRIQDIEASLRCPQCSSQSVANSDTPSSKGVKVIVRERVKAGQSDEQIRDFVASKFGREVLLDPAGKGFGALVWGVPVAAAVIAVGALVLRFGDWRPSAIATTDADRDLVAEALGGLVVPAGGVEPRRGAVDPGAPDDDPGAGS